eukprot:12659591-Alexandrium_andersonii.AAC.1
MCIRDSVAAVLSTAGQDTLKTAEKACASSSSTGPSDVQQTSRKLSPLREPSDRRTGSAAGASAGP